jgi:CBS domain-containing protein
MSDQAMGGKSLIGIVESAHLVDAARLMIDKDIGALGVYSSDQHELVGVITEKDITRAMAKDGDPGLARVTEEMSTSPVMAEGPISRSEAADLMRVGHVRHLIIKQDGSDRIVSIRDL